MIHNRKDYMEIQDPTGNIGEDEPVFLLRAKDVYAPQIVRQWTELVLVAYSDNIPEDIQTMCDSVLRHADNMNEWQNNNGAKAPDVPVDQLIA